MMEESVLWNLKSHELKLRKMIPNSSCQACTQFFVDLSVYDRSPDPRLQMKVVRRKTVALSENDLDRVQVNIVRSDLIYMTVLIPVQDYLLCLADSQLNVKLMELLYVNLK